MATGATVVGGDCHGGGLVRRARDCVARLNRAHGAGRELDLVPVVAIPLAVQAVLRGPFVCGPLVLRARHLLNEALALRVVTSIVSLVVPTIGIFVDGARGAAWGIAISAGLNGAASMAWLWRTRSRGAREIGDDELPDVLPTP